MLILEMLLKKFDSTCWVQLTCRYHQNLKIGVMMIRHVFIRVCLICIMICVATCHHPCTLMNLILSMKKSEPSAITGMTLLMNDC